MSFPPDTHRFYYERARSSLMSPTGGDGVAAAPQYVPLLDSACTRHPEFTGSAAQRDSLAPPAGEAAR